MPDFSVSDSTSRSTSYSVPDGMNPSDLNRELINSILGPVGKAKSYGNGQTEGEKQAKEQLKQIEKLNDGLKEATDAIKDVIKVIELARNKASVPNASNLTNAMNRMSGSDKKDNRLEKEALTGLKKMAHEAVTGHSLHVHDHTLVTEIRNLHRTVADIGNYLTSPGRFSGPDHREHVNTITAEQLATSIGNSINTALGRDDRGSRRRSDGSSHSPDPDYTPASTSGEGRVLPERRPGDRGAPDEAGRHHESGRTSSHDIENELNSILKLWYRDIGMEKNLFETIFKDKKHELTKEQAQNILLSLSNRKRFSKDKKREIDDASLEVQRAKHKKDTIDSDPRYTGRQRQLAAERLDAAFDKFLHSLEHASAGLDRFWGRDGKAMDALNKVGNVAKMMSVRDLTKMNGNDYLPGPGTVMDNNLVQYLHDMNQIMFQTTGHAEDIRKSTKEWYTDTFKVGLDVENLYAKTGKMAPEMRKEQIALLKSGIRGGRQLEHTLETGLSLSSLIGSETSATTNEFAKWVRNFNMSSNAASSLSSSIRQVARLTGVTSDNLLSAVQAARPLSQLMFNMGLQNPQNSKIMIQAMAEAQKVGNESSIAQLMTGLTGQANLNRMDDKQKAFFYQAAGGKTGNDLELMKALQEGTITNRPDMMMRFAEGMQRLLFQTTKNKKDEDMTEAELRDANLVSMARFGKGVNELQLDIDTFRKVAMTTEQKIGELETKMKSGAIGSREKEDIQKDIDRLKATQAEEKKVDSLRYLSGIKINEARGIKDIASDPKEGNRIKDALKENGVTEDQIKDALEDNNKYLNLIYALNAKEKQKAMSDMQRKTDPLADAMATIAAQLQGIQKWFETNRLPLITSTEIITRQFAEDLTEAAKKLIEAGGILKDAGNALLIAAGANGLGGLFSRLLPGAGAGAAGGGGVFGQIATAALALTRLIPPVLAATIIIGSVMDTNTHREGEKPSDFFKRRKAEGAGDLEAAMDTIFHAPKATLGYGKESAAEAHMRKTKEGRPEREQSLASEVAAETNFDLLDAKLQQAKMKEKLTKEETHKKTNEWGNLDLAYHDSSWTTPWGSKKDKADKAMEVAKEAKIKEMNAVDEVKALQEGLLAKRHFAYHHGGNMLMPGAINDPTLTNKLSEATKELAEIRTSGGDWQKSIATNAPLLAKFKELGINDPASFALANETGRMDLYKTISAGKHSEMLNQTMNQAFQTKNWELLKNSKQEELRQLMGAKGSEEFQKKWIDETNLMTGRDFQKEAGGNQGLAWHNAVMAMAENPEAMGKALEKLGANDPEIMKVLGEVSQSKAEFEKQTKILDTLVKEATTPGSLYVHDTHVEPFIKDMADSLAVLRDYAIAMVNPDMIYSMSTMDKPTDDAMIQRRVATEFAGIETNDTITIANDLLADISAANNQQVELLKQNVAALMRILQTLSGNGSGYDSGNTENAIIPENLPKYYNWAYTNKSLPNFGGR